MKDQQVQNPEEASLGRRLSFFASSEPSQNPSAKRYSLTKFTATVKSLSYSEMETARRNTIFFMFLALFTSVSIISRIAPQTFYWADGIRKVLLEREFYNESTPHIHKRFGDIATMEDIWQFLEGPLWDTMYNRIDYNNKPIPIEEAGMVLSTSSLMGGIRLRTVRVLPESCEVEQKFRSMIKLCYGTLTPETEERLPYGPIENSHEIAQIASSRFLVKNFEFLFSLYQTMWEYDQAHVLLTSQVHEAKLMEETDSQRACTGLCNAQCRNSFLWFSPNLYEEDCSRECHRACQCFAQVLEETDRLKTPAFLATQTFECLFKHPVSWAFAYVVNSTFSEDSKSPPMCKTNCSSSCVDAFNSSFDSSQSEHLFPSFHLRESHFQSLKSICNQSCAQACDGCFSTQNQCVTSLELQLPQIPKVESSFQWKSGQDLQDTLSFWGIAGWYPPGGYAVDLPALDPSKAKAIIAQLKKNGYLDRATRILLVDFTLFNPSIDSHLIMRLTMEMPATGGVIPRAVLRPLSVYKYESAFGQLLRGLEVLISIFIVFFFYQEATKIYKMRCSYFSDTWNILDMMNVLGFTCSLILHVYIIRHIEGLFGLEPTVKRYAGNDFPNLQSISFLLKQEANLNSLNALLLWFRVFKYLTISQTISFLLKVLSHAMVPICNFFIITIVLFLGFAQAGFLAFSTEIPEFRNFGQSFTTLIRSLTSGLNYERLVNSNRLFGPLYYLFFQVAILLILLNMFIAILNNSYTKTRQEEVKQGKWITNTPFKKKIRQFLDLLKGKTNFDGVEMIESINESIQVEKVMEELQVSGATMPLAKKLFQRFDSERLTSTEVEQLKKLVSLLDLKMAAQEEKENLETQKEIQAGMMASSELVKVLIDLESVKDGLENSVSQEERKLQALHKISQDILRSRK